MGISCLSITKNKEGHSILYFSQIYNTVFAISIGLTDIFNFIIYYVQLSFDAVKHYFEVNSIYPIVVPLVASLILGAIEYVIVFWINPKKYELIKVIFLINFVAFIVIIILSILINYLGNVQNPYNTVPIEFVLQFVSIITIPILLLAAIIGYFAVRYLRNKGIIKRHKLFWFVMLTNYITYSVIYIIFSITTLNNASE